MILHKEFRYATNWYRNLKRWNAKYMHKIDTTYFHFQHLSKTCFPSIVFPSTQSDWFTAITQSKPPSNEMVSPSASYIFQTVSNCCWDPLLNEKEVELTGIQTASCYVSKKILWPVQAKKTCVLQWQAAYAVSSSSCIYSSKYMNNETNWQTRMHFKLLPELTWRQNLNKICAVQYKTEFRSSHWSPSHVE